jgi:hypothetical protein
MTTGTLRIARGATLSLALLVLCFACFVVARAAIAQSTQTQNLTGQQTSEVERAISRIKSGTFTEFDILMVVREHQVQAVPALETQFQQNKDPYLKSRIADALVWLGDNPQVYWSFMLDNAREVLLDVPPTSFEYDTAGAVLPGRTSKKLDVWATKHNMSAQDAYMVSTLQVPSTILALARHHDVSAIPVLEEALRSQNDLVKAAAAKGLAELHDTKIIPQIITACQNSPREAASVIAESLVYFDDPEAQRAVDLYVPKAMAKALRDARANEKASPYR